MKKNILFAGMLTIFLLVSCSRRETVYHLYYLGGQSNMDGYGYVAQLPADLNAPVPGVMIYHGNTSPDNSVVDGKGIWSVLQPGHGAGFRCDGDTNFYSDRFGVELTFAKKIRELIPDEKVALVKYSRGGTSIDTSAAGNFGSWFPDYRGGNGINQYDHFLATVKGALSSTDIDGDGLKDKLIPSGILWMQGESDGNNEYAASIYKSNLKMIIDTIRYAFSAPDMSAVIGRISESHNDTDSIVWTYGDIIRQAQADFVTEDGNAALVTSTDNYKYSDPWHYDSDGYIDLGEQFAIAMAKLRKH